MSSNQSTLFTEPSHKNEPVDKGTLTEIKTAKSLRSQVIRLAHEHPEFRNQLLPLVTKKASDLTPIEVRAKTEQILHLLSGAERILVGLVREANPNGVSGSELRGLLEALQEFRNQVSETDRTLWEGDYEGIW